MVEVNNKGELSERLAEHWPKLASLLSQVYTGRPDLELHLEHLREICIAAWEARDPSLKALDRSRPAESQWYTAPEVVGTSLYVDLFAEDLKGLNSRLDYLAELGVTYVHLMPMFEVPKGNSDGGYAVSSFRALDPRFGDITELKSLAHEMRSRGMSLALDFIFIIFHDIIKVFYLFIQRVRIYE